MSVVASAPATTPSMDCPEHGVLVLANQIAQPATRHSPSVRAMGRASSEGTPVTEIDSFWVCLFRTAMAAAGPRFGATVCAHVFFAERRRETIFYLRLVAVAPMDS